MEWIKCSEKIPKSGTPAIVAGKMTGRFKKRTFILIAEYYVHKPGFHDDETGWWLVEEDERIEPTHWMPLPDPPAV